MNLYLSDEKYILAITKHKGFSNDKSSVETGRTAILSVFFIVIFTLF